MLLPTSGQSALTLFGKNFAFSSSLHVVLVGISSCSAVIFTSDTTISCTSSSGWGLMHIALVHVNSIQGISSAFINFSGDISNPMHICF